MTLFQSTPPARGATNVLLVVAQGLGISIHAPREGGDVSKIRRECGIVISIHAPREGGDYVRGNQERTCYISIHAPREGGD